jgi:hypothetical protein
MVPFFVDFARIHACNNLAMIGRCELNLRLARHPAPCESKPAKRLQDDPYWRDLVLFYEYFHGDAGAGLGANHQTGWTGFVTKLVQQSPRWKDS